MLPDPFLSTRSARAAGRRSHSLEILEARIAPAFAAVVELSALTGDKGFQLNGAAAGDAAGLSLSDAGDINGDGIDDFVVGAPKADPNGADSGAAYVLFGIPGPRAGTLNLAALNGSDGFRISGALDEQAGFTVSAAGDLNGDGIDDLVLGAPGASPNGAGSGAAYVVFGSRSPFAANVDLATLPATSGFKISGAAVGNRAGHSVSAAGDINGDGIDDLIVGAPYASVNGAQSGASYVIFGKRASFGTDLNLSSLTGTNGFRLSGAAAGELSGKSVSAAGDLNADGIDDLVIGAPYAAPHGTGSGAAYVVFGSRTAFAATLTLSTLSGANGFKISGIGTDDHTGFSVSAAGDLNGDGIDDVVLGAYSAPDGTSAGATYVLFGSRTPLSSNLELSGLTGANGFKISGGAVGDLSGRAVSAAGDLNGDGLDDLLIGAPQASPHGALSGAGYVIFGSRAPFAANLNLSVLAGSNGFKISGPAGGDYAGRTVSAAGDVNGDGLDDLLIGAPYADPNGTDSGRAYVLYGQPAVPPAASPANLNLSALNGNNGFKISGAAAGDSFGADVSRAGDINGDGIDDFLVGAVDADPNGTSSGATYVIFGRGAPLAANLDLSTPLTGANGFRINGVAPGNQAGQEVSAAGDINGDGIDDLVIGAYKSSANGNDSGAAYVVFGSRAPFAATLEISSLTGPNGFRITGAALGDQAGIAVSGAGDFNGDGIDDLLIGANGIDALGTGANVLNTGGAYVIFGSRTTFPANFTLATLTPSTGVRFGGVDPSDQAGRAASGAGDINGDGIDDIIIGAHAADPNGQYSGASYVVFGSRTSFGTNPSLSTLNGTNGFKLSGGAANDRFGRSVAAAGDVNGDGIDDLIVGAYGADPNGDSSGAAYVVFGSRTTFAANINVTAMTAATGFKISGVAANDNAGRLVSGAGDVNGDGVDDLLIGADRADPNGVDSGAAYVVFGSRAPFASNLNLSTLTGANGFKLSGVAASDRAGMAVSAGGDINGDGLDDLLVGALLADANGVNSGAAYVVFGPRTPPAVSAVSVAISPTAALESSAGLVYTFTRVGGGSFSQPLTVSFTTEGTAVYLTDYTVTSNSALDFAAGFLTIPANSATATVTLIPIDDQIVEGNEVAILKPAPSPDYTVAGGGATGTFTDNDFATISFVAGTSTSDEAAGSHTVGVQLLITSNGTAGVGTLGETVRVNVQDLLTGTALNGGYDYTLTSPTVTFAAGTASTTQNATLTLNNDTLVEGAETVKLALNTLADVTGQVSLGAASHTISITDNDTATLAFYSASSSATETMGAHMFALQLIITGNGVAGTGMLERTVSVKVQDLHTGTAAAGGGDYTIVFPEIVSFGPGSASQTWDVYFSINDDRLVEGEETVNFALNTLSDPTGQVTLGNTLAHTVHIVDNDVATLQFVAATSAVGEAGSPRMVGVQLVITANGAGTGTLGKAVSVKVEDLLTGSALAGTDYNFTRLQTLTFAAGSSSTTNYVTLQHYNDIVVEGTETVNFGLHTLNDPTGQVTLGGTLAHTLSITDNDTATLEFVTATSTPGEARGTQNVGVYLLVTANGVPGYGSLGQPVSVRVADLRSGTAFAGGTDYTFAAPATITFDAGSETSKLDATVSLNDDTLVEGTETVNLALSTLSDPTGQVTLGSRVAHTLSIKDNDTATLQFAAATSTAEEGDGTLGVGVELVITANGVAGSGTLAKALSVKLRDLLTGSAAGGGTDYDFNSPTTFNFAAGAGSSSRTALVSLENDALVEGTEQIALVLESLNDPTGQVTLGVAAHTVDITDNDTATIGFSATESTVGEATAQHGIDLVLTIFADGAGTPALARDATVHIIATGGTAAAGGVDYALPALVTFGAGSHNGETRTASLNIVEDPLVEGSETAVLGLAIQQDLTFGQVSLATGAGAGHTMTITDDDVATLTLGGGTAQVEGDSGPVAYTFTATLDHPVQGGFSVAYTTKDGTATADDGDYSAVTGTLTFTGIAGETQTVTVLVNGDQKFENDEDFTLTLGALIAAPEGVSVAGSPQTGTITNDDAIPTISIADTSVTEGHTGATQAHFTVTLSNPSYLPVMVDFMTADSTAMAPGDYALTQGTLTFTPGETSRIISVDIRPDTLFELGADETFLVRLSHPSHAVISDAQAVGTILADDSTPAKMIIVDAKHPYAFFDHNHDRVTVRLSGLGSATLILDGGVLDGADISEIKVANNAVSSTLSIAVAKDRKTGDGLVRVGEVTVDGALQSFSGAAVDFAVGGLRASGPVKTITAHSLLAGEIVTGISATDKLALTFTGALGSGGDPFVIAAQQPISTLKAASIGVGRIEAAALGSMIVTAGSLAADITSAGAIGAISVKGGSLSGDLTATRFGAVSISGGGLGGSLSSLATAVVLGKTPALTSLSITGGSLTGDLHALGTVGAITVKTGQFSGNLTAASFGAVTVTAGDLSGSLTSLATSTTLAKVPAVKSLAITGGSLIGDLQAVGAVGPITVRGGSLAGNLTAASFSAVSVTGGDFSGSLTSLTPAATLGKTRALTSLTISDGNLTGDVRLLGASGAITVASKPALARGSITGASIVAGAIASLTVARDLTSSIILAGADLGADHAFGGGDDIFAEGTIGAVKIGGAVSGAGSILGAGFSSPDATFKDGNDTIIGRMASVIASLTITGRAAPESYFAAGLFKIAPKIAGAVIAPAGDGRFKVG